MVGSAKCIADLVVATSDNQLPIHAARSTLISLNRAFFATVPEIGDRIPDSSATLHRKPSLHPFITSLHYNEQTKFRTYQSLFRDLQWFRGSYRLWLRRAGVTKCTIQVRTLISDATPQIQHR